MMCSFYSWLFIATLIALTDKCMWDKWVHREEWPNHLSRKHFQGYLKARSLRLVRRRCTSLQIHLCKNKDCHCWKSHSFQAFCKHRIIGFGIDEKITLNLWRILKSQTIHQICTFTVFALILNVTLNMYSTR